MAFELVAAIYLDSVDHGEVFLFEAFFMVFAVTSITVVLVGVLNLLGKWTNNALFILRTRPALAADRLSTMYRT